MNKLPILFTVFNRADTAVEVMKAIRQYQPERLYLAADGPRANKPGEDVACQETRSQLEALIDWPCEVKKLYREQNKGCKLAMSEAITWFFENEEMGVILEDDCLPHPSFFNYMTEVLTKYADDERIMMVSGDNFQAGQQRGEGSYYFSMYPHIWGWGSWRRAWQKYNVAIPDFPEFVRSEQIKLIFENPAEQTHWLNLFQQAYDNKINTWDYQWVYTIFKNGGLVAAPNVNLISNIGFGNNATHTSDTNNPQANVPTSDIGPIKHPEFIIRHRLADEFSSKYVFWIPQQPKTMRGHIKRLVKTLLGR
jgi:hypothetical protein